MHLYNNSMFIVAYHACHLSTWTWLAPGGGSNGRFSCHGPRLGSGCAFWFSEELLPYFQFKKRGQKSRFVGPAVNLYCQAIHRVRSSPERCCENDLRNGDLDLSVLSIIEMFWWHGGCDMWSLHSLCKCREASSRTCCLVEEIEEMEESRGFVVVVLMDTDAIVSTCCCVASLAWTAWLHRDFVKSF